MTTKKIPYKRTVNIGRNSKCVCGSDKKWKKCCGVIFTETLNCTTKMNEIFNTCAGIQQDGKFLKFIESLLVNNKINLFWDWLDNNGHEKLTNNMKSYVTVMTQRYKNDVRRNIWVNEFNKGISNN